MDFKQYFLYQTDYQHWANDALFNALDRLDDAVRTSEQRLFSGSIHNSVDHLVFFHQKWASRLKGESGGERYTGTVYNDWRELKNALRHEIRSLQRWLEQQPSSFFDSRLSYRRTNGRAENQAWVRDALTHIFTYASLERGQISAVASMLGAPHPSMTYYTYRMEMGEHLENMRREESGLRESR